MNRSDALSTLHVLVHEYQHGRGVFSDEQREAAFGVESAPLMFDAPTVELRRLALKIFG